MSDNNQAPAVPANQTSMREAIEARRERTAAYDQSRNLSVDEDRMASAMVWARDSKAKEDEAMLTLGKTQQMEVER